MADGNSVDLVGNVTRDVTLRFTPGGMAVAQFGLAVNRRRQDRSTNEWKDETSFFDVVAYGTLAENVSECVPRGTRVVVQGRLEQRSWETQDGDKRSKIEVIADEIGPSLRWATAEVTKNERRGDGQAAPQQPQRQAPPQGGGFERPAPTAPAYDYSEEPF